MSILSRGMERVRRRAASIKRVMVGFSRGEVTARFFWLDVAFGIAPHQSVGQAIVFRQGDKVVTG
jgi:hypothetical protein